MTEEYRSKKVWVADRCSDCGSLLCWWEGESACPDCDRWGLVNPVPALDDIEAVLLGLARLISEDGGAA